MLDKYTKLKDALAGADDRYNKNAQSHSDTMNWLEAAGLQLSRQSTMQTAPFQTAAGLT